MKRFFLVLIFLEIIILVFASCAGPATTPATTPAATPATSPATTPATAPATTPATAPATTPATAPVTTPATTEQPQYGGVLKIRSAGSIDMPMDPLLLRTVANINVSPALERLIVPGTESGTYQYVLAISFTLAQDKSYYDISLRQGVKFHDGTDFDAQAVKWNLDRVLAKPVPELRKVKSIDVIDDHTVRLNLSSWDNRILNDLWHDPCFIISPTSFEKNGADWAVYHPIGTGPFVFKELQSGQCIKYVRNDNYWAEGLPYLDGLELHYIPNPVVAEAALKTGEIHGMWRAEHTLITSLESDTNFQAWISDDDFGICFYMNTVDPESPWYDSRMRQALEYAVDKTTCTALSSLYSPCNTIIKGLEVATELDTVPREYNPTKAKELMAAAGYADGLQFKIYALAPLWGPPYSDFYLAWQAQMAEVGFIAEYELIQFGEYGEMTMYPLVGSNVVTTSVRGSRTSPLDVVIESLTEGTIYFAGVRRPANWPTLLEKAMQTEDPDELLSLLAQMEESAYDEAMIVPLATSPILSIINSRVHNVNFMREGFVNVAYTWLSKE